MSTQDILSSRFREDASDDAATVQMDDKELRIKRNGTEPAIIPIDNVIAVIPRPHNRSGKCSILYTTKSATVVEGAKESPSLFNSIGINNLPQQILEILRVSNNNDWLPRQDNKEAQVERHVLVSTGSGTGLASAVWENLVKPLLDSLGLKEQDDYQLHFTTSETSVTDLTQKGILPRANDGIGQKILLLSGDGGIVDIVNSLLPGYRPEKYKKPSISLLPLGTGNALANSSGINTDSTLGLSTMLRGSPKTVPLFRATFSPGTRLLVNQGQDERPLDDSFENMPAVYGAVVCSWGLHATLVADSDTVQYRKFGAERFKLAGKEALFPSDGSLPHAYKGKVFIRRNDKMEWENLPRTEHGYILATLVSQLEAGFTISPASKPLDGKLHLVHFGQLSGEGAMEIMSKAYQGGKHVEDDTVGYEEIEALRIEFDEDDARWRRVCLDGKIVRVEKGGWVEVHGAVEGVVDLVSQT